MRNLLLSFTSMMSLLWSQENGHATAELWLGAPRVESGKPTVVPAAIRIVYEKDWHGYWSNPGEGGMKTELRWKLPAGVRAGDLQFPAPHREMTGELACYGYTGEVLLPVLLTVEQGKKADAAIEVTVSWLACNDTGCAAGEATIKADLAAAVSADDAKSIAVQRAFAALPAVDEKLQLHVKEADGWVELSLSGAEHLDLDGAEIFPATEQALDPREAIFWKKSAAGYQARVKKNEYAPAALSKLSLVVVPRADGRALAIDWKK